MQKPSAVSDLRRLGVPPSERSMPCRLPPHQAEPVFGDSQNPQPIAICEGSVKFACPPPFPLLLDVTMCVLVVVLRADEANFT